jgi:hypothetical protein
MDSVGLLPIGSSSPLPSLSEIPSQAPLKTWGSYYDELMKEEDANWTLMEMDLFNSSSV